MEANVTIVNDRYAFSDKLVNGATTHDMMKGHKGKVSESGCEIKIKIIVRDCRGLSAASGQCTVPHVVGDHRPYLTLHLRRHLCPADSRERVRRQNGEQSVCVEP